MENLKIDSNGKIIAAGKCRYEGFDMTMLPTRKVGIRIDCGSEKFRTSRVESVDVDVYNRRFTFWTGAGNCYKVVAESLGEYDYILEIVRVIRIINNI